MNEFNGTCRSTVVFHTLTVMMLYIKGIPQAYSSVLGTPHVAIMNAMACRMYRNIKLGLYNLPGANTTSGATSKPIAFQVVEYPQVDSSFDGTREQHRLSLHTKLQRVKDGEDGPNTELEQTEKMV
jgi:hypothetical protein